MTIEEVAKIAGVSRAAVSRYLNNGYISDEKRESIRKAIEQTGYVPSRQAQMMRSKKTGLIGVIIPKISSEAVARMVSGIGYGFKDSGYQIIMADTENNVEKEFEYLSLFKKNRADGIIFIATLLNAKHTELLKSLDIPAVIVGQRLNGFSCVYHDDANAAKALTKLMLDKGRKRIAYIGVTEKDKAAGKERKQGYLSALKEAGVSVDERIMKESEFTSESGYIRMKSLLLENENIDGVFCATDNIAIGAINAIREEGLCVPDDVSVTGLGHTRMSDVITPKLATAHYFYKTSGIEAAKMLLDKLERKDEIIKETKLGFKILENESV